MSEFNEELTVSTDRLKKLKANIHIWSMQSCIDQIKQSWKPKMRTLDCQAYEGAVKGDEPFDVLYWDVANAKWTHRNAALKSHIFQILSNFI